ncbi:MAG: phospho-N-acetylmuramoyl-pentapeptide-transferase [Candidatus Harrisonbacteria bacterium RIFCSPLOWO2_02_FULL_41_11]|uniref:Phospho-N-acetylmuramoyl-pentapeptide-transferase n=1 Tax=Candidatus Harrisonbacteria bacterium RIFCSPHIGHO2_02_FULL_42_16 TaxID=1798404 RepID=A0A1G1ZIF3_9BACT|nr:MAG: phospho-N-acetylmuramoyl-pentapeptide-transferase [Candidatus Harrisonbacteria bacterium RIFCSPHIGHO2_02_FULL_42_16]OGY67375.1 MAG: phospho-N-acetylmuramoyl-pentapeptide-transferase [Candidatus Harrisonbacteria bacterium RIFCSPLOWO2_02_FULL_41_11]
MEVFQVARVLGLSTISFLVAIALTPALVKFLYKFNFNKQIRSKESAPVFYGLHKNKENTPTMGGIIIWATTLGLALIFFILAQLFDGFWASLDFVDRAQTYLPIIAMLAAAALGLVDDLLGVFRIGTNGGGLRVSQKLVVYTFLALIGGLWFYFRLDWTTLYVPFVGNVEIGWWYIPIFMFIIIASAFSTNETDGLDGLAGGVLLFAFGALTVVAFTLGRYDLATFSGITVGALLAFLWFNIYPARFFMGDTGSMALGISMGVMVMLTNTTLLLPFFASILVIESLSVITQLASKKVFGRKIFLSTPIHHHFEALGWPETKVTMRFWIISAVFSALGLSFFFIDRLF